MRVVSVHVPRTGGHSLWSQMATAYGERFVSIFDYDPIGGIYAPQAWPEDKDVVHGHFRPELYEGDFLMTWLRWPVDIVIGLYSCYRNMVPQYDLQKRLHSERPTLIEFAEWP